MQLLTQLAVLDSDSISDGVDSLLLKWSYVLSVQAAYSRSVPVHMILIDSCGKRFDLGRSQKLSRGLSLNDLKVQEPLVLSRPSLCHSLFRFVISATANALEHAQGNPEDDCRWLRVSCQCVASSRWKSTSRDVSDAFEI